jgi:hypothetical protein
MPTWYGTNTTLSPFQELSETSPGANATASPVVGWVHGTGSANGAHMDAGATVTEANFTSTTPPDGTLDTTTGDGFRTASTYNGSFASANWTVQFALIGVTQAGAADGHIKFRLFRSANADGSGATQITSAQQTCGTITNLSTTQATSSLTTFNPGVFSVTNEHLFFQVAWHRSGAGGMSTTDVIFRWGTTATLVTSSTFTAAATPSLLIPSETVYKRLSRR